MKSLIRIITIMIVVILSLFITAELLAYGSLCKMDEETIISVSNNEAEVKEFIDLTSGAGSIKTIFVIAFLFLVSFTIVLGLNWNNGKLLTTIKYMSVPVIVPGIILSLLGIILKVGVDFDKIVVNENASAITIIMTKLSSIVVNGILQTGLITFAVGLLYVSFIFLTKSLSKNTKR